MASEVKYEIKEHISAMSERNDKGWRKELNLVSWNEREPKYDIRDWNEDYTKCGKGVTLTYEELAIMVSDITEKGVC